MDYAQVMVFPVIAKINPFDYVDKVTTPFALTAFIVAIVFWYLRYQDLQKRKMLNELNDDSKIQSAQIILSDLHIDTSNLSDTQKYNLAMQKLKDKARHRLILSSLLAFLSVIALIMVLFYNPSSNESGASTIDELEKNMSYEISLEVFTDSIIKREIKDAKEHINDHCEGDTNINWRIPADTLNGWYIDLTTIMVSENLRDRCVYSGIFDQSKLGFNLKGIVRNTGNCVEVLGNTISDARGKMRLTYSYIEEKNDRKKEKLNNSIKGNFLLGEQIEVEIPENTATYNISITNSDNLNVHISNIDKVSGRFKVSKKENNKLIIESKI